MSNTEQYPIATSAGVSFSESEITLIQDTLTSVTARDAKQDFLLSGQKNELALLRRKLDLLVFSVTGRETFTMHK
jgi:hypothetical protein